MLGPKCQSSVQHPLNQVIRLGLRNSVQARGDILRNTSYTESQQASDTEQLADDT